MFGKLKLSNPVVVTGARNRFVVSKIGSAKLKDLYI
jgi:hypothetical protein